jgi:hypothetical protein
MLVEGRGGGGGGGGGGEEEGEGRGRKGRASKSVRRGGWRQRSENARKMEGQT